MHPERSRSRLLRAGGAGGSGSGGNITIGGGNGGESIGRTDSYYKSGHGGASYLSNIADGSIDKSATGVNGESYGGGGSAAYVGSSGTVNNGGGGGGGCEIGLFKYISQRYSVTIGVGGAAGANAGSGKSGICIIEYL